MRAWIPLGQASPIIGGTATTTVAAPVAAPVVTDTSTVVTTQTAVTTTQPGAKVPQDPQWEQMLKSLGPIALIVVALYFFMFRGQRKEEKSRKLMISEMKKGDEVMTIGGLIGKVVDVREDRVVLKVDEGNNVKETYLKSAIQKVLTADGDDKK